MSITTIKNNAEYEIRLLEMEALIDASPEEGTDDFEKMLILGLLISQYENNVCEPVPESDPVDVIEFYMEQNNLTNRDLAPYIGSPARVSEILNRKRELSKSMIKALHNGLRIPADLLLRDTQFKNQEIPELSIWELAKRGWVSASSPQEAKKNTSQLAANFLSKFAIEPQLSTAHYRRTVAPGSSSLEERGLQTWQYLILAKAQSQPLIGTYNKANINDSFLTQLRGLSVLKTGPKLAIELLSRAGIHLVFEKHFEKTRLDGAATTLEDGTPVIGVTLRHNRLDNFWFVLFHELAHVVLHLDENGEGWFLDELDDTQIDPKETAADDWALDKLLNNSAYKNSDAYHSKLTRDVIKLAEEQHIHSSIVAGRIRNDNKNYRILNKLVGHGEVRAMFTKELEALT